MGQIFWDKALKTGIETAFRVAMPRAVRLPEVSIFVGDLACAADSFLRWLGLKLGPLRSLLFYLMFRADTARVLKIPLRQRLMIGGAAGLLTCLSDALVQFVGDSREKTKAPNTVLSDVELAELRSRLHADAHREASATYGTDPDRN